jgi:nicotinate-nucleotide adenylyltransferase
MKQVGLFFGSFNPIHIGHMIIADHVALHSDVDEIWFMVSPQNPLKEKGQLLHENHRLEMVRLAVAEDERFIASDFEFQLEKPSYTVKTLQELKHQFPEVSFSLILGGDNLASFSRWKNYKEILETFPMILYNRPEFDASQMLNRGKITQMDAPLMNISSTLIRTRIENGMDVKYLMPHEAWRYLHDRNLYK